MSDFKITKLPWDKVIGADYYEESTLDKQDIENIKKSGAEEAWYYYGTAPYEGHGEVLVRNGDSYDINSLGHCSCFGPFDEVVQFNWKSKDEFIKSLTEDYKKQVIPLLNLANIL